MTATTTAEIVRADGTIDEAAWDARFGAGDYARTMADGETAQWIAEHPQTVDRYAG
jgi:hypothetical protein